MWNKVKTWTLGILTALSAILIGVIKSKNRKIENLEEKQKTSEVEIKAKDIAVKKERETNIEINDIQKKYAKKGSEGNTYTYSDLIENWNDEKK